MRRGTKESQCATRSVVRTYRTKQDVTDRLKLLTVSVPAGREFPGASLLLALLPQ